MPEAPWVNRCLHGTVVFTETQKLAKTTTTTKNELLPGDDDKEDKVKADGGEGSGVASNTGTERPGKQAAGLVTVKARLLDNYVVAAATLPVAPESDDADRVNLSLLEEEDDSRLTIADNFREH